MSFVKKNRIAIILIFVGIAFLSLGIWQDEAEVIFRKAVNICMECIGLG